MDLKRLKHQLDFIKEIDRAKSVFRQTLLLDRSRCENDAEHSWHLAVGVMVLAEYADHEQVNLYRVIQMCLIHDIVEIDAGDTFAYGDVLACQKELQEKTAAKRIFGLLPADQFDDYLSLWNEFEEASSPDALLAKTLDSFMPLLHNYTTEGQQWKKHGVTSAQVIKKNEFVKKSSLKLWQLITQMIEDSVKKGYLDK